MKKLDVGFDLIRSFAVFFVVMGHTLNRQIENDIVLLISKTISPDMTMSALGFISAYLLSSKYNEFNTIFYIKRFSRIYSPLIICLSAITVFHLFLKYDVINQHSIIHFMGLSFFMQLFEVSNKSSLGNGLWFVTIIILMYLLLPLISTLYNHKHAKKHLFVVILLCLFFNHVMYGTVSAWNVVMAFNIGCYVGINSNIVDFTKRPFHFYIIPTIFILFLVGLTILKVIPYQVKDLLLPFYPFFVVPLLYKLGNRLNGSKTIKSIVVWFSSISYEVYIIHFYFIYKYFLDIFPTVNSIYLQILISASIVLPLAYLLSKVGIFVSNLVNRYFLLNQK